MTRRAIVIGGGPAGIKAAHHLVKSGAEVTLLESAPVLGGLASAFDVQGVRIERYYHFICKGDDHLVETLGELGLSHKLHWRDSRMAYFVDGRLYPFLTPVELLMFRALPLHDRSHHRAVLDDQILERHLGPHLRTLLQRQQQEPADQGGPVGGQGLPRRIPFRVRARTRALMSRPLRLRL